MTVQSDTLLDKPKIGVGKLQGAALAAPSLSVFMFLGPMSVIPAIYAKNFGMTLTSLALIILVSRLFDAITDPLVGYISDRNKARTGTRKPFVLTGGILLIPCGYFLFVPPIDPGVLYFVFWSIAFYLAYTIYHIPHYSWASEITTDPKERNMVFSMLLFLGQIGTVLFYFVPFLPVFETTSITLDTLKVSVIFGTCLMLPCLYIQFKFAPNGQVSLEGKALNNKSHKDTICEFYTAAIANKPFLIFVAAYMCLGLGLGMWAGLYFIYVDAFLGLGEQYPKIAVLGILGGMMVTPLAYRLSLVIGKKNTWLMSSCVILFGLGYTGLLNPDNAGFIDLLILQVILTFGTVCVGVLSPALLSDTIDYGKLKDSTERNGTYFSVYALLVKIQMALGASLGLAIAGFFGFDVAATLHSETSIFGIHLAISWIPFTVTSLGLFFSWKIPLDERRNEIVRRRIESRIRKKQYA